MVRILISLTVPRTGERTSVRPRSCRAWTTRAFAYERAGDKEKAAGSYARALNIKQDHEPAKQGFTRVGGKNIAEASELSIRTASTWFGTVIDLLTPQRQESAQRILREICERLQFLVDVGLDHKVRYEDGRFSTVALSTGQRKRLAGGVPLVAEDLPVSR